MPQPLSFVRTKASTPPPLPLSGGRGVKVGRGVLVGGGSVGDGDKVLVAVEGITVGVAVGGRGEAVNGIEVIEGSTVGEGDGCAGSEQATNRNKMAMTA
jgi:hypothetical protein